MASEITDHKLLLVDDERDILNVLKIGLEQKGFDVDAYDDPQLALDHYKLEHYMRVITDIRMPKMSGFEFARQITTMDKNAKICFMSSFEILHEEAKRVFPDLPSYCFITKPITPSELAQHIAHHNQDS